MAPCHSDRIECDGGQRPGGFELVPRRWRNQLQCQKLHNHGGPYTTIASPTTTSYTNTGLANGTTYYYVVSATAGGNASSNSIQAGATPVLSHVKSGVEQTGDCEFDSGRRSRNQRGGWQLENPVGFRLDWTKWIYVDLQATYNITEVAIYWEAAYAASFQIQVSSDATNWTSIYSTTTGNGNVQDLTGLSGTGRYVRIYMTVRGLPAYGYSLYELQIYGTAPAPTNHPPVLAALSNQTIMAGRTLLVTNSATDADTPAQTLTFSLLTAPTNAAINSSSGLFTWRPTIAQSPSTQTVAVIVADSGTPIMTATQSFTATVTRPAVPALNSISITNGRFGFLINGSTGPDYTILVSTNLTSWNPIFTGNSLPVPCYWVDTNSLSYPIRFYRTVLGP